MSTLPTLAVADACFELRFEALERAAHSCAFPCDEAGRVDLDELSDGARRRYLYAHTLIGRDFARPVVRCIGVTVARNRAVLAQAAWTRTPRPAVPPARIA